MTTAPAPDATLADRLRGDARRAVEAAVASAAVLAAVELVATVTAAPRFPGVATLLRFALLAVALAALLIAPLALLYAGAAIAARLFLATTGRARALGWRGLFAPDAPPDPAAAWLLAAALGGALYVAGATAIGVALAAGFKERTLIALVGALVDLALLVPCAGFGWLIAAGARRLGRRLHPRLGRASPFGGRAAALALLALLAVGAGQLAVHLVPPLRPLIPWRHLLAALALAAGAELDASVLGPRRRARAAASPIAARTLRRRRIGAAAAVVALIALALGGGVGADAATKALWLSSSPPLTSVVDAVRWANDVDRDGFGSLLGENDCAPFDAKRNPLARDLPDNGIDENCDGRDFELGRLPSYKKGERMPVPAAYRGPWNVLLLTVDTVRYDHTTMGGYRERRGRDTTPNLAAFAARSASFADAVAPSAGTMASVPAILTSRFFHSGIALGEERKGKPPVLKPQNLLLSEVMKRAGYATGAILSHEYFNDWGMEQGFDTYDNEIGRKPDAYRVSSDRLTDRALGWIGERADQRWFLWVHYLDPHGRYVPHPGGVSYGASEEDLYDGELAFTDEHVGRLLRELERLPGGDRTVVVITSDHGDAFNEHGFINHGQALYVELLHVPLIVYVPNIEPRLIPGPVSPLDIFPTLADLAGADLGGHAVEGESLVPQLFYRRDARERVVFAETNYPKPQRAVVTASHKLIYRIKDNLYELYDRVRDPGEQKNLWPDGAPAAFTTTKRYLDDWLERVYYARDADANQNMAKLKDVLLEAPPTPAQPIAGASFDGGAIEVVGIDVTPAAPRAGDKLEVSIYLRTARRPSGDFLLQLEGHAAGPDGTGATPRPVTSPARATAGGTLPTSRWRDGEFIRDRVSLKLPANWGAGAGGTMTLGLRLLDGKRRRLPAAGDEVEGAPGLLRLGTVEVAPRLDGAAPPAGSAPAQPRPVRPD